MNSTEPTTKVMAVRFMSCRVSREPARTICSTLMLAPTTNSPLPMMKHHAPAVTQPTRETKNRLPAVNSTVPHT